MQFVNQRRTALQYPLVHWTLCRCQQYGAFSMKALARYQIILLGEQRHIMCEQLAQGCCPNNAAVGVEPATSRSGVQLPTAALPSHLTRWITLQTCDLMDWALHCHYFTNKTRRMCKLVRSWVSDRSCTL